MRTGEPQGEVLGQILPSSRFFFSCFSIFALSIGVLQYVDELGSDKPRAKISIVLDGAKRRETLVHEKQLNKGL